MMLLKYNYIIILLIKLTLFSYFVSTSGINKDINNENIIHSYLCCSSCLFCDVLASKLYGTSLNSTCHEGISNRYTIEETNTEKSVFQIYENSPPLYRLLLWLNQAGYIKEGKERSIIDRPLLYEHNSIELIISALQDLENSDKTITHEQIDHILNQYLGDIVSEVVVIKNIEDVTVLRSAASSNFKLFLESNDNQYIVGRLALHELLNLQRDFRSKDATFNFLNEQQALHVYSDLHAYFTKGESELPYWDRDYDWSDLSALEHSTLIPLPYPDIAKSSFENETSYEQLHLTIRSLLFAGFIDTAIKIMYNTFYLIDTYGFIPKGNRKYYLDRSYAPYLTIIVSDIIDHLNEINEEQMADDFAQQAFPRILIEYIGFWLNPKSKRLSEYSIKSYSSPLTTRKLVLDWPNSRLPIFHRYYSNLSSPRIENFLYDWKVLNHFDTLVNNGFRLDESHRILQSIRAASESGWDMSSRWHTRFTNRQKHSVGDTYSIDDLIDIDTVNFIPSELNWLFYHIETLMCTKLFKYINKLYSPHNKYIFDDLTQVIETVRRTRLKTLKNRLNKGDVYAPFSETSTIFNAGHLLIQGIQDTYNMWSDYYQVSISTLQTDIGLISTNQLWSNQSDYPHVVPLFNFFSTDRTPITWQQLKTQENKHTLQLATALLFYAVEIFKKVCPSEGIYFPQSYLVDPAIYDTVALQAKDLLKPIHVTYANTAGFIIAVLSQFQ